MSTSPYNDWVISPTKKYAIVISLIVSALLIAAQDGPLEGMHWDVPIYLYQAKRFAETHYLVNYVRHAADIAAQVSGHWPADESYSEAFWRFIRLGHIATLGGVVGLLGSTFAAIVAATWLYTFFLIGGIAFCFGCALTLNHRSADPVRGCFTGAVISTGLFLLSDIYRYLAGNLVSEVLSIFLLGAALYAMSQAFKSGRLSVAALSGLLAFLSYTTRIESVWTWLSFMLAYVVTSGGGANQPLPWKSLLVAGFAALGAYLAYATLFYPLADPRQYLTFVSGLAGGSHKEAVSGHLLLFVAGGMLWIGALICLRWLTRSGLVRLGWLWLALSALPWLPQLMLGGDSQTRMMALLIPPLFPLSSVGWSLLLEHGKRLSVNIAVTVSLCLALVSQPVVYDWLHGIPGVWRIQSVRPFLFAPRYERSNYLPAEMAALSRAIYSTDEPTVLVLKKPELNPSYFSMIRFFGTAYSADSDLALRGDPINSYRAPCDHLVPAMGEKILFCQGYSYPAGASGQPTIHRTLFLRRVSVPATPNGTLLLKTPTFALDEVRN